MTYEVTPTQAQASLEREWTLPREGMAADEVLATLSAYQAENPSLLSTIMSIGINYGGEELEAIRNQAHAMFSHDNNMVVDMRPGCLKIENELMDICAGLLSGGRPEVVTTISSGGTESIFNGIHTAKMRARRLRGDGFKPKWVGSWCAHPALSKACHYLDIDLVRTPDRDFRADVDAMAAQIDERTIGLYASAPSWPFGLYDDISALGQLALEHDLWLHVDACVGGFVAPFVQRLGYTVPPWDFSVPGVCSISADLHKWAYGMKPLSVVGWRDASLLQDHYVVVKEWPEFAYVTPGFGGSRTGGTTAAAWAVMHLLGEKGYLELTSRLLDIRQRVLDGLRSIDGIRLPIPEPEMCSVVYDGVDVTVNQLLNGMYQRGWLHFSVLDPPMVQFILDPCCGEILDRYLSDLAEVVELARDGKIEDVDPLLAYGSSGT
jgi:sphinganine-1-phosphate aldolase